MYMPIANTMTRLSKPNMPLMGPSPEGNCTAKPGGWQVTGGYVYQESELVMQSNGYVVCVEVSRSGEPEGGTAHRGIGSVLQGTTGAGIVGSGSALEGLQYSAPE